MQIAGTEFVQIVVNGEVCQAPAGLTVEQLLVFLELDAERVAIEMNKVILRRRSWSTTSVSTGTSFEIVQFVGGG
jgi:thiamine biosynthesis protein ThiS